MDFRKLLLAVCLLFASTAYAALPNRALLTLYVQPDLATWEPLIRVIEESTLQKHEVWVVLNANSGNMASVAEVWRVKWKALVLRLKNIATPIVYVNMCNKTETTFPSCEINLQGGQAVSVTETRLKEYAKVLGKENIEGVFMDDTRMDQESDAWWGNPNKQNTLATISMIRQFKPSIKIVTNPGWIPSDLDLIGATDVIVYRENSVPYTDGPTPIVNPHIPSKKAMVLHHVPTGDLIGHMNTAASQQFGWFFATPTIYTEMPPEEYLKLMFNKLQM